MFRTPPLQREKIISRPASSLQGLHCREVPDNPLLLEVAAKGFCEACECTGFYNFMRIMKPVDFDIQKSLALTGMNFEKSDLKPALIAYGELGQYHCPSCYLAAVDPLNFGKELV